jgi:hypothetical protein
MSNQILSHSLLSAVYPFQLPPFFAGPGAVNCPNWELSIAVSGDAITSQPPEILFAALTELELGTPQCLVHFSKAAAIVRQPKAEPFERTPFRKNQPPSPFVRYRHPSSK